MKYQRKTVHAVAQAGRLRPIIEEVTEMAAAAAAVDFGTQHPKGAVFGLAERVLERLIKTRPAGAALEFGVGGEQRQVAAGAGEGALAGLPQQRARPPPPGPVLAQDLVLLRRELRPPFRIGLFDLELLSGLYRRDPQPAECGKAKQAGGRGKQDAAINHKGLRANELTDGFAPRYGATPQKLQRPGAIFLTFQRAPLPARACRLLRAKLPGTWIPSPRFCPVPRTRAARDVLEVAGPAAADGAAAAFRPG